MRQAALALCHEQTALASARVRRATARREGADPAALDLEIQQIRERVALLVGRFGDGLPIAGLAASRGLDAVELDVLWLVVSRHTLFATTAARGGADLPLTRSLVAEALADSDLGRLEVHRALSADGRLRRHGLLQFEAAGDGPTRAEVARVPGFLPWWLAGERVLSDRLCPHAERVPPALSLGEVALADELRAALARAARALVPAPGLAVDLRAAPFAFDFQAGALVILSGPSGVGKSLVAKALACELGRHAILVDGAALGALTPFERWAYCETLVAEAGVTGELVIIERADLAFPQAAPDEPAEVGHVRLEALLQRAPIGLVLTCEDPTALAAPLRARAFFALELPPVSRQTAPAIWRDNTPGGTSLADPAALAQHYALSGRGIQNALNVAVRLDAELGAAALEVACRAQQSAGMSATTQRVRYARQRSDLLVAPALAQAIDDIIATEAVRERTLETWGLAARFQKGLGLICLFDGEPGTGKTLAAEVIASELALPLYAVNIPNVVSKWVGETEKNLQRIFEDANRNRCVVLFDEADSLFGKRTGVERASDRYANMEINVLLQLVEGYRGLVVLTTNLKEAIDPAFARRFTFKLSFGEPDAAMREAIWRRLLPERELAADADAGLLAREFELTGGAIKNVILRASFRAAASRQKLALAQLRDAAVDECRALGKLVRSQRS